ncbi:MAG: NAD(P)-dependent oxidoreductase [Chthonomonadales bacterium]|nr:NAD(P)-dependent oxidoreductase [Chthonomonadales bacterium]
MMQSLQGRRVALIGGAGFIGHNLALSLASQGAHVEIIDGLQVNNLLTFASASNEFHDRDLYLRIINQRLDLLREAGVPLHIQDARDYHALTRLLNHVQPHAIVHLAAVAHAGHSNKDPYSTFDHSLRTLENALDAARGQLEHFVYLSSSMAYGTFRACEVTEEHPLEPMGIYGALKVAGEKMVIAYQQVFDLPYTIIRPSALYGPRCVSRRVGQVFVESAIQGGALRVDGDGTERLDFTYIDDLVAGIELVLTHPSARNQVFNITYGQSRSINDLVGVVRAEFPGAAVEYVPRDRLMPLRGTLCIDRARDLLGYRPTVPIEAGFPRYVQWYHDLIPQPRALARLAA